MALSISKLFLLIFATFLFSLKAESKIINNSKIVLQYAGEIGRYSAGFGHQFNNYYSISGHYGFVPSKEHQNKIETYTLKNNLHFWDYSIKGLDLDFYTGASLFHVPGNKYKTQSLAGTEDNYYRQSSIRSQVYVGNSLRYRNNMSFYWESGINDIWIINSANNDSIDPKNHISLALGFNYWLN